MPMIPARTEIDYVLARRVGYRLPLGYMDGLLLYQMFTLQGTIQIIWLRHPTPIVIYQPRLLTEDLFMNFFFTVLRF